MKNKKIIALLCAVLFCGGAVAANQREADEQETPRFSISIHTGIDIGGAVPWPMYKAVGGGNKLSAVPKLTPALGFSFTNHFDKNWSVTLEGTYKAIALDAKTRTKSQIFKDKEDPDVLLDFEGKARADMSFAMIEVPLYVRYSFNNKKSHVILGGYYAHIIDPKFEATAIQGTLTNKITGEITVVYPSDPYEQDFKNDLDNWDIGFLAGYEHKLMNRLTLGGRVSVGFKDIFKPNHKSLDYSMWHMRGTVMLSYKLFDR